MKIAKALKVLLIVQVSMYALAMLIIYVAMSDGTADMAGLAALGPLLVFGLLCFVNLILYAIYLGRVAEKKVPSDKHISILVVTVVLMALLYDPIIRWAESLS